MIFNIKLPLPNTIHQGICYKEARIFLGCGKEKKTNNTNTVGESEKVEERVGESEKHNWCLQLLGTDDKKGRGCRAMIRIGNGKNDKKINKIKALEH